MQALQRLSRIGDHRLQDQIRTCPSLRDPPVSRSSRLMLAQPSMIRRPVLDLGDRRLVGLSEAAWSEAL